MLIVRTVDKGGTRSLSLWSTEWDDLLIHYGTSLWHPVVGRSLLIWISMYTILLCLLRHILSGNFSRTLWLIWEGMKTYDILTSDSFLSMTYFALRFIPFQILQESRWALTNGQDSSCEYDPIRTSYGIHESKLRLAFMFTSFTLSHITVNGLVLTSRSSRRLPLHGPIRWRHLSRYQADQLVLLLTALVRISGGRLYV